MKCHDWSARAERRDVAFCRGETRSWQESVWSLYCVGSVLLVSESYSPSALFYLSSNYFRTARWMRWRRGLVDDDSRLQSAPRQTKRCQNSESCTIKRWYLSHTHKKTQFGALHSVVNLLSHLPNGAFTQWGKKKKKETTASFLVYSP